MSPNRIETAEDLEEIVATAGALKGSQTSSECSNLPTSPLVFTDDQCESTVVQQW
jgi:hypothetical protein